METQKQIQLLRHHLLDMSKLAHRAVDYAIKGYRLGSPEFCRFVRRGDRQLVELRRRITSLCQNLQTKKGVDLELPVYEKITDPDVRFTLSAMRISESLYSIFTAASEIAHHTMLLLEETLQPVCESLERLAFLANRLTCLAIVGLFKQEHQHAETVINNRDTTARLVKEVEHHLNHSGDRYKAIPAALLLGIANSLNQIARQSQEMAEIILFCLQGRGSALESGAVVQL